MREKSFLHTLIQKVIGSVIISPINAVIRTNPVQNGLLHIKSLDNVIDVVQLLHMHGKPTQMLFNYFS